ncbi:hypothetical protein J2J97_32075 (plasmid) [Rhizobium bangladeshense]|uniref:hypothetical protein n=1 Tax=Rhizobium bangladeshense TaxID=1138189 RepID=UPI001A981357|nr:hypothetical protein [Rhizobium bangladeshense]QSY98545.1 hypothetical protein J2J97_32075 [Rhizobium bangladeshense]
MSELRFNPVSPLLNCAVALLCARVWPQGFDVSSIAPSSYHELKAEYDARGKITVLRDASDRTIFDDAGTNQKFRAWHDWAHLQLGATFSLAGEAAACELQCQQIEQVYGTGETGQELTALLRAEVIGQSTYWQRHRTFVKDQVGFVKAYLTDRETALARAW